MPNWKKVVVSGSDALISHLTASGGIKAATVTGTVATATQATIDHDSLSDNSVTLRSRDTGEQKRVSIDELPF